MIDWDDLRIFIVTARSGSFAAAAVRLSMDASTVGRHIQRFEEQLKCTLFVRSARGLQLTAAGARLQEAGARVETAIEAVSELEMGGALSGNVRISASEGFGTYILAPALAALVKKMPGITIELVANQGFLSPSTREVDMAITLSPPRSTRLFAEPLTEYELGLYASKAYVEDAGRPQSISDLGRHSFVGYIDDLIYAPELRYLDEIAPGLRTRTSSSSIRAQLEFVAAGMGLGVLPCFMADEIPSLERVLPVEASIVRTFWVSTHQDIKTAPRISAVRRWLTALVQQKRSLLRPSPA